MATPLPDPAHARFEALFAAHHEAVLRYARRRSDTETALEVTGETFLTAWRRRDAIPEPALPWLYGVARRALANARRREATRSRTAARLILLRAHEAVDHADAVAAADEATALLARLPVLERDALLLIAWEGLQVREAALALGCTPALLRLRLFRLRRRLRALAERPAAMEVRP